MRKYFSLALALLLLLGLIRGGATSVSKFVAINDVPPLSYAMWQSIIAATIMLSVYWFSARKLPPLRLHFGVFSACALIGAAIPNVLFFYVVKHIHAGTMAVLLTFVPIITYALVLAFRLERIDPLRVLGISIGFAGALLIAMPNGVRSFDVNTWVLIGLLCPAGYAAMSVIVSTGPLRSIHPYALAAGTHSLCAGFLIAAVFATGEFYAIWQDPGWVQFFIVVHGLIGAVAYTLFFKIVQLAGPVFYSFSAYIIAICGLGWGWLIFGETHEGYFWLAVALIFSGLGLVNYRYQKTRGVMASGQS